jgi:hypothetical protein
MLMIHLQGKKLFFPTPGSELRDDPDLLSFGKPLPQL